MLLFVTVCKGFTILKLVPSKQTNKQKRRWKQQRWSSSREQRNDWRAPAVKIWLELKRKQIGFVETFGRVVPSHDAENFIAKAEA